MASNKRVEIGKRIEVDLCNGVKLVAEVGTGTHFPAIYIGLERNGVWFQDLTFAEQSYDVDGTKIVFNNSTVDVALYGDEHSEDYTQKIRIPILKEEDYE